MVNHKHYTYRVMWSEEDQEYVGTVAEFPSLSYLHENQAKALAGIVDLVEQVVADMTANDEPVPEPLSEKEYSGKFMVRIPPEQHRRLAVQAAEERVSLNRYVSARLAASATASPTFNFRSATGRVKGQAGSKSSREGKGTGTKKAR
jgi:predicted HicB family RNase H-like nuclease